MAVCSRDPRHVYPDHNKVCPWCQQQQASSATVPQQTAMTPVTSTVSAPIRQNPQPASGSSNVVRQPLQTPRRVAPLAIAGLVVAGIVAGFVSARDSPEPNMTSESPQSEVVDTAMTNPEPDVTSESAQSADDLMSIPAAGQLFLDGVCPRNRAVFAVDDLVVAAQSSEAPLDLVSAQRSTADFKSALEGAVSLFGETRTWPDAVQKDVDALLGEYALQITYAEQLLGETTAEGFVTTYYAGPDQFVTAELGARIRAALELEQDAFASCGMQR